MTTMASQITSLTAVYSIVYSGADQGKHQSSASFFSFIFDFEQAQVLREEQLDIWHDTLLKKQQDAPFLLTWIAFNPSMDKSKPLVICDNV